MMTENKIDHQVQFYDNGNVWWELRFGKDSYWLAKNGYYKIFYMNGLLATSFKQEDYIMEGEKITYHYEISCAE